MAFEKLRTIVITAIPKPRSRERFRKIAETTPTRVPANATPHTSCSLEHSSRRRVRKSTSVIQEFLRSIPQPVQDDARGRTKLYSSLQLHRRN